MLKRSYITKMHFELYDTFVPRFRTIFVIISIVIAFCNSETLSHDIIKYNFLLIYLVYALILLIFKNFRKTIAKKYPVIMVISEILIITYGIANSYGESSPFYMVYIIQISFFAIAYNFKSSFIISCISAICYLGALIIGGSPLTTNSLFKVFFLISYSCFAGLIAEKLNKYNIELATTDQLTFLYNRQFFYGQFEDILSHSETKKTLISLIVIDLDNFKFINDKTGHLEGDRILAEVGHIIRENIKNDDIAARYGGDEFVIVLPDTNKDEAVLFCNKLEKITCERLMNAVSFSSGYATFPYDGKNIKELFHVADMTMYQAKTLKKTHD